MNTRALSGALLAGAGLGLVLAVAYLAGGAARNATRVAAVGPMTSAPSQVASLRPGVTPTPAALRFSLPRPAAPVEAAVARGKGALDCLTDAVYYEARGESDRGQAAVAQVVLNRVRRAGFPKSVCGVVFQGAAVHACQFSFVCDGAMSQGRETAAWRRARSVAQRALDGVVMEEVGDATNFHVARLGQIWGSGLVKVAQVGAHVFYKLTGHGTFVARAAGEHVSSPPDDATAIPADLDQASLILASAVTIKAPGQGGPAGPVSEPASAPAPAPAKPPAATPKAPAPIANATPPAGALKGEG